MRQLSRHIGYENHQPLIRENITRSIEDTYRICEKEEQNGFRAEQGFLSKANYRKERTPTNREVDMVFIDLQKAFDNVQKSNLWDILQENNVIP